jgi:hypothetical protein
MRRSGGAHLRISRCDGVTFVCKAQDGASGALPPDRAIQAVRQALDPPSAVVRVDWGAAWRPQRPAARHFRVAVGAHRHVEAVQNAALARLSRECGVELAPGMDVPVGPTQALAVAEQAALWAYGEGGEDEGED